MKAYVISILNDTDDIYYPCFVATNEELLNKWIVDNSDKDYVYDEVELLQ